MHLIQGQLRKALEEALHCLAIGVADRLKLSPLGCHLTHLREGQQKQDREVEATV